MDVAGLESLAGGRTGGHPYSGPDGEKRFAKMKENVVKEWEEEQRKKEAKEEAANAEKERAGNNGVPIPEVKAGASESRLERLKARLFKH